jgi:chitinase
MGGRSLTCQSLSFRVLLSIGGATGCYGLSSTDDANCVADYLPAAMTRHAH